MLRIGENWYVLHASITCVDKIIKPEQLDETESQILWQTTDPIVQSTGIKMDGIEFMDCNSVGSSMSNMELYCNNEHERIYGDSVPTDGEMIDEKNDFDDQFEQTNQVKIEKQESNICKSQTKRLETEKKRQIDKKGKRKKNVGKIYKCDICVRSFARSDYLTSHNLHVHSSASEKPFKCEKCTSSFVKKSELERHQRQNVACDKCGESYCLKPLLQAHQKNCIPIDSVGGDEPKPNYMYNRFECDICKKVFAMKCRVKNHILQVHCASSRTFKCDICRYSCFAESILRTHKRLRHSDPAKNFICSECGKTFHAQYLLRLHSYTHSGYKPYECTFEGCTRRFGGLSQRLVHMRSHTGVKPYACTVDGCDRHFVHLTGLKRHKFRAHGIYTKKFSCNLCPFEFAEHNLLKRHLKTHGIL